MVVGHRLAPIGHDKSGIGCLRLAEGGGSGAIFEIVKEGEAAEEGRLGGRRAAIGEADLAEILLGQDRRRKEQHQGGGEGHGQAHVGSR